MAFQIDSSTNQAPFKIYLMTNSAYDSLIQGGNIDGHSLDENAFYLTTDIEEGSYLPLAGGSLTGKLFGVGIGSTLLGSTTSPNGIYYVEGSGTVAGTWLGTNALIQELYTGLCIFYKIPIAGASTTTLNLNNFGAVTVKRNDSNFTTHLPVGSVVPLVYDGAYWCWADYSTSNNAVTQSRTTTSSWRPVLQHNTAGDYGTNPGSVTSSVYFHEAVAIQPSTGKLKATAVEGAVWNDYAEYRVADVLTPGRCIVEDVSGSMKLSTERLQPGAEIISDTFGFSVGETVNSKTPIAVAGRVLAYPYEDRNSYPLGCAVCSGPNGTISQMSREEIREYPERIIGTVSEIPQYDVWGSGNVKVDGRIWIKVR